MRGDRPVSGRQEIAGNSGEVLAGKDTSLQSYSVRIDYPPEAFCLRRSGEASFVPVLHLIDVPPLPVRSHPLRY